MTAKEILYDMTCFLSEHGMSRQFDEYMLQKGFTQEEVDEMNEGLDDIESLED